jgi:hypothetical protein
VGRALFAFAVLALAACRSAPAVEGAGAAAPEPARSEPGAPPWELYEAVFRHMFAYNASAAKETASAYHLSIEGADPPAGFLARFARHHPPVRPGSAFAEGAGALLFEIEGIERVAPDAFEVRGGYYEANESAAGSVYRVELRDGRWTVTSDEMQWISGGPPIHERVRTDRGNARGGSRAPLADRAPASGAPAVGRALAVLTGLCAHQRRGGHCEASRVRSSADDARELLLDLASRARAWPASDLLRPRDRPRGGASRVMDAGRRYTPVTSRADTASSSRPSRRVPWNRRSCS